VTCHTGAGTVLGWVGVILALSAAQYALAWLLFTVFLRWSDHRTAREGHRDAGVR
jgi:hypothetical protein